MENLDPPLPPQIKDGKMVRFCPSRGFILDLGWGFDVPFYFVQDCSSNKWKAVRSKCLFFIGGKDGAEVNRKLSPPSKVTRRQVSPSRVEFVSFPLL